jgi:hypothetical protein
VPTAAPGGELLTAVTCGRVNLRSFTFDRTVTAIAAQRYDALVMYLFLIEVERIAASIDPDTAAATVLVNHHDRDR